MKTALIIHGMPSKEGYFDPSMPSQSNRHWLPWLQKQLIINGILTQAPEMPEPYEQRYELWKKEFERFDINEDTTLIGYSCGGGFLIRWLSENNVRVGKVLLVAPWTDPTGELDTGMFDFEIDTTLIDRVQSLTTFYSLDDDDVILKTVDILDSVLID
jgi:predicted alpha/beta hydrolase family esterase